MGTGWQYLLYGRSPQVGVYVEVDVCLPFGIASPLKLTLGSEARITFEVRRLSIPHDLGGDLSGEIRPPTPKVSFDTTIGHGDPFMVPVL